MPSQVYLFMYKILECIQLLHIPHATRLLLHFYADFRTVLDMLFGLLCQMLSSGLAIGFSLDDTDLLLIVRVLKKLDFPSLSTFRLEVQRFIKGELGFGKDERLVVRYLLRPLETRLRETIWSVKETTMHSEDDVDVFGSHFFLEVARQSIGSMKTMTASHADIYGFHLDCSEDRLIFVESSNCACKMRSRSRGLRRKETEETSYRQTTHQAQRHEASCGLEFV